VNSERALADLVARAEAVHALAVAKTSSFAGDVYAEARAAETVVGHTLAFDAAKRALEDIYADEVERLLREASE
jgi:hypothetical protein